MKATARRVNGRPGHEIEIGCFRFAAGAPGGEEDPQSAPTPQELLAASLAACSAASMQSYARRHGWEIGDVVVEVDYELAQRGSPTRCCVVVRMPEGVSDQRRERLMSVLAKSPVHRALEGETMFEERVTVTASEPVLLPGQTARRRVGRNAALRRLLRSSRQVA